MDHHRTSHICSLDYTITKASFKHQKYDSNVAIINIRPWETFPKSAQKVIRIKPAQKSALIKFVILIFVNKLVEFTYEFPVWLESSMPECLKESCNLYGPGCDNLVKSYWTPTVSLEENHEEPETDEDRHVHVLE